MDPTNGAAPRENEGRATDQTTESESIAIVAGQTDDDRETCRLRQAIEDAAAEHGLSLADLTVLDKKNDPFRVDTPSRHRDGKWLADRRDLIIAETRKLAAEMGWQFNGRIYLRGSHYAVLGQTKPDGSLYLNDHACWTWLSEQAAKAARWLEYLPFDLVEDHHHHEPVVRRFTPPEVWPYITVGLDVRLPDADDLTPHVEVLDFRPTQPYKLVIFAEKSSVSPVAGPIAERHQADLYLCKGEISDTYIHQIARIGAEDGRPMVVVVLGDCDPSGWQMAISISQKLRAFKTILYPHVEFEVHRAGLTPVQVRELGLPSEPLKPTERRAEAWQQAMGVAQTELDALASRQPRVLAEIILDALRPFYDPTLDARVAQARVDYLAAAQAALLEQLDVEHLDRIRAEAQIKLAAMQVEIDRLNDALRIGVDDLDLPTPVVPEAILPERGGKPPLLDSRWSFADATRALLDSKRYRTGGDAS